MYKRQDIHLTRDGHVVVFHDHALARMTGDGRNVEDCTLAQLRELRLAGSNEHIPTFEEVLDLVAGRVGLLIEIKSRTDKPVGPLEEKMMAALRAYRGHFAVQSFDPRVVRWLYKRAPGVLRGQLSCDYASEVKLKGALRLLRVLMRDLRFAPWNRPQFIAYGVTGLPQKRVSALRAKGVPTLGWTVRSKQEYARVQPYVDNLIFEGFIPE